MKIIIFSYGILRDLIGSKLVLEIECGNQNACKVADLVETLILRYPAAKPYLEKTVIVKMDKALRNNDVIRGGDVITLLPPGSGG